MSIVAPLQPTDIKRVLLTAEALSALNSAMNARAILGQSPGRLNDQLQFEATRPTELGKAAHAFIAARDTLNAILDQRVQEATMQAESLGRETALQIFGQPIPGLVILPGQQLGTEVREYVASFSWLRISEIGHVSGYVRTLSNNGRVSDTRMFGVANGRMSFLDHDIL